MQSKVNYTVVGIFVVMLTTFFFFIIFWLSTASNGKNFHIYLVYVHEDVTGLSVESPVRFNGVKVGFVQSIHLDPKNPKLVRLKLAVGSKVPVTTSTYAILNAQGITGVVYVNLKAETETAPLLVATAGQRYPIIPSRPSLLMQLSTVLPEITADIQHLSSSVAQVLDDQNRLSIKNSLQNIATITKTLADNSVDFTETIRSLNGTLANMSEASNRFPETMDQLNKTLKSVNALSFSMNNTSQTIAATMRSGQAAINNFSNQVLPNAAQALSGLSQATSSVDRLTEELQRDPSMLVRGKQAAQLGPGER